MRAKNEFKFIAEAYQNVHKEGFNELENKREKARDRGREAEDKGDWDEWNRQENEREGARDALREIEDAEDEDIFPNSEYGRSLERDAKQHEQEDKEMRDDIERLQKLVADGYVRLHRDGEFQVLAPWMGDTNFPILKGQGWEEVPFPSIRLTLNEPGTASVHLRPPYTDIDKYLDKGYKVVDNYVKATQSEDNEYGYRETRPDTPPDREYQEEDPRAGEPEYDEERSKRFREDDIPDISDEDRRRPTRSIKDLDDEIVTKQDIANKERSKRLDDRVAQIKRDFRGEDNETRAQKAKRRREEKQRYNLHGNVLKHVKGSHDIYKK